MKKPKIICTLGTTTDNKETLEDMIDNGMVCARMNTAYASIDEYQNRYDLLKEAEQKAGKHVDVMMDLKGPQVRLCTNVISPINKDDIVYAGFGSDSKSAISFSKNFYKDVEVGDIVLLENGTIKTEIIKKKNDELHLLINDSGEGAIKPCMGVNVPGKYLHVSRLSKKDMQVIDFCVRNEVEYIALSFVRDYTDIACLQKFIDIYKNKYNSEHKIGIIAKIEDINGINNLDNIICESKKNDINLSVMVARGDLSVELPVEQLPYVQNKIIDTCKKYNVFNIVATGVLESMQYNNVPTRAEVNDVYCGLREGTNAFMFSGETSNGKNPAKVVETLSKIMNNYYDAK
jgi:pyruvate kinase